MDTDHKLAAILFADIANYTAMMQANEKNALAVLNRFEEALEDMVPKHQGQIVKYFGDGCLLAFDCTSNGVDCAIALQKVFNETPFVPVRMGLHMGDVVFKNDNVFGDGVNIASRIESLGVPGSILISKTIRDQITNKNEFSLVSLGYFDFKNVLESMEIFALANDGLIVPVKEKMSGKLKETQKKSSLRKWKITSGIFVLFIAAFLFYKNNFSPTEFVGEKSIAVLPFENTGTENKEEYINDGITQDIINNLSKVSSLEKVIGWLSVRSFKKSTISVKQIASELGVATILAGTIQRQGDRIHIIAELIQVSSGKRLWGQDYNYNSKDLLSIQANVAKEIVNALQATLTKEEKKGLSKHYTENIEAYKFYGKGRYFWDQRTKESYDSAEMYYKKAIELDPEYALAYAGLADLYTFNQKGLSQREAIPIAREYAKKALSLDSTLTEALTTIAFIQFQFDYDMKTAKQAFQKIIHDYPNYPIAHLYYGNLLVYTGHFKEGINENKKALSLDPLSTVLNYVLCRNYYYGHEYDSSIAQFRKTLILNPKFKTAYVSAGLASLQKKLSADAIDAFSKLPPLSNDQGNSGLLMLSYAYALTGDLTKAKSTFEQVPEEFRIKWPYFVSYVYLGMGDTDGALTQLEYAYRDHAIGIVFIKTEPAFDLIRNEPRFKALLKKTGLDN